MRSIKYVLFLVLCLGSQFKLEGQQLPNKTTLSTFDFSLNPSMTAPANLLEAGGYYSQQWSGFESAPSTAVAYFQYPFFDQNMSAGVYLLHDEINILEANEFAFSYCYKAKIGIFSQDQFSIGLSAGLRQLGLNGNNVIAMSENDPLVILENSNAFKGNLGAGIFYMSNRNMYDNDDNTFFIGLGTSQILPTKYSFIDNVVFNQKLHANALIGGRIVNEFIFIEPSISLNYIPYSPIHFKMSVLVEREEGFWAGLSYHNDNTLDIQFGIIRKLGDGFLRIGALGGYNIGTMGQERGLGYEFFAAYQFAVD